MVHIKHVKLSPAISADFVPVTIVAHNTWPVLYMRVGIGYGAIQDQRYDHETDEAVIVGLLPRAHVVDGAMLRLRHIQCDTGVIGTTQYRLRVGARSLRGRGGGRGRGMTTSKVGRSLSLSRTARR